MATLNLEGIGPVKVDDTFLSLSPEQQAATVEEIVASIKAPTAKASPDIGQGMASRVSAAQGVGANFADELSGVRAAGVKIPGLDAHPLSMLYGGARLGYEALTGDGDGEATKAYTAERDRVRGLTKTAQEQYPKTAIASEVGGAIAGSIGPAALIKGATYLSRLPKASGVGAGLGGLGGAGEGETTEGRLQGAAVGAGLGAATSGVGETLISGVGRLIQRYLGAAKAPAPGVSPAARIADADEFGIPLSRGQASGNVGQQAFEEAARHEARGRTVGMVMRGFDDTQATKIKDAQSGISQALGGTAHPIPETGGAVSGALKSRAAQLRSGAEDLYASSASKEANIAIDEVSKLGRKVAAQLETEGVKLDTYGNYQGAQAAMNLLRRVAGFEGAPAAGPGQAVVSQSLQGLDQARKGLLKIKAANPEDGRALSAIRRSFDDWIDDAVDKKLFSGDATAIDDLKKARSLWSQYRGMTKGGKDDATPIIAKIVNEERTGEEVANWLLGIAGAGQAGRSSRMIGEIKHMIGAGSPEWEALRQAAWSKMTAPARGEGPQAVANSIIAFTSGQGAPVARQLFTPQEIGQMTKLARVMQYTVADKRATNPSKSGYAIARLVGAGSVTGSGGAAWWWTGDPKFLAIASLPLIRSGASLSKAVAARGSQPSAIAEGTGAVARVGVAAEAEQSGRQWR